MRPLIQQSKRQTAANRPARPAVRLRRRAAPAVTTSRAAEETISTDVCVMYGG